ncbi:MAG: hypothetical protein K2Q15_14425, partial [Burkholderiales bacterium]|nr:hypothetical protein [Burkholderiales bacterium]
RAASFTGQLIQQHRKQKTRKNNRKNVSRAAGEEGNGQILPGYADLFPESWLDFCREQAIEAVDSPVSYLVDLYRFVQEVEADASRNAVTLDKRRPDIAQLALNNDSTYQELPELKLVNDILALSIQKYKFGANAYQELDKSRFPFTLPYSFPNNQIHVSLAVKNSNLSQLVQINGAHQAMPLNVGRAQLKNVLFAAAELSATECKILTEQAIFSQYQITAEQLQVTNDYLGYLSGSTTEMLPDADLRQHGYVVPGQVSRSGGPTTLVLKSLLKESLGTNSDTITLTCVNEKNGKITITLKGESVLTYQRVKARMVQFDPSNELKAYSRQLRLSWDGVVEGDDQSLKNGPYYARMDVNAQTYSDCRNFAQLHFAFAIAAKGTMENDVWQGADDYFKDNYGISPEQYPELKKVTMFGSSVSGTVVEIEQLLAQGDYRPQVSPNVRFTNSLFQEGQSFHSFPESYHYGAKYINSAQPLPLSIVIQRNERDGWREMSNTSAARYERMNRFLRLARWSALPHDKLDLLLTAAMQADQDSYIGGPITDQTLRAYGLYCYLNERYTLAPDVFSAMIDRINVYSISPEIPLFDRIFNQPQLFDTPFVQDDGEFTYTDLRDPNVKQICSGLAISGTTFQLLASLVSESFGLEKNTLQRTAPILSALYRLVQLPALFKLSPEEGLDLLNILGKVLGLDGAKVWAESQHRTFIKNYIIQPKILGDAHDTLDVILLLEQLVAFMRDAGFTASELTLLLNIFPSPLVPTQGMVSFFSSIQQQLKGNVLLSEASFQRPELSDVADLTSPGSSVPLIFPPPSSYWMNTLVRLVEPNGLVKPYPLDWDQTDTEYLQHQLEEIVKEMEVPENSQQATIGVLTQIIAQAKSAQDNLVATAVANEYGIARELANLLLRWCNSSVTALANTLLDIAPLSTVKDIPLQLLELTYSLLLRVAVVSKLKLSFDGLFMRLANSKWLSVEPVSSGDKLATMTLSELWLLNDYRKLLKSSTYTEEEIQDYFSYANSDKPLVKDCANLLADIIGWDSQEVQDAAATLETGYATNQLELNWLRRVQALAQQTGMSVLSVISASQLTEASDSDAFNEIGQAL